MTSSSPGDAPDLMFLLAWASNALLMEHGAGVAELGISPRGTACCSRRARAG